MSYPITSFLPAVNAKKYDINNDGIITEENGELQELLSGNNTDNVNNLLNTNPKKSDYIKAIKSSVHFGSSQYEMYGLPWWLRW